MTPMHYSFSTGFSSIPATVYFKRKARRKVVYTGTCNCSYSAKPPPIKAIPSNSVKRVIVMYFDRFLEQLWVQGQRHTNSSITARKIKNPNSAPATCSSMIESSLTFYTMVETRILSSSPIQNNLNSKWVQALNASYFRLYWIHSARAFNAVFISRKLRATLHRRIGQAKYKNNPL